MSSRHDYVNPAFCQKSEFYKSQKSLSPPREIPRNSQSHQRTKTDISNNPLHNTKKSRYAEDLPPKPGPKPRYALVPGDTRQKESKTKIAVHRNENVSKSRYELTELEENEDSVDGENIADVVHNGRIHRYAVIPTTDDTELRYESLPPMSAITRCNDSKRYGSVPTSPVKETVLSNISPARRQLATQLLHELLAGPVRNSSITKSASFSVSPSGLRGDLNSPVRHTSTPKQYNGQLRSPRLDTRLD